MNSVSTAMNGAVDSRRQKLSSSAVVVIGRINVL
jgi:hypothetical protein